MRCIAGRLSYCCCRYYRSTGKCTCLLCVVCRAATVATGAQLLSAAVYRYLPEQRAFRLIGTTSSSQRYWLLVIPPKNMGAEDALLQQ